MNHGSLFTGIGGFDEGFRRAGMQTLWQVEIEPFCRAVLQSKFPGVELLNDVTECGKKNLKPVNVVTAGFPCQDLSVAGKRAGLAGKRSGLFYHTSRIIDELLPDWFVIENVPGLLSSPPSCPGRDMQIVLTELTGFEPTIPQEGWETCGVCIGKKRSVAWRVLDSQFFGVAQRRRRVFFVSGPRTESAFEILFESESGEGNFAESGEAWAGTPQNIAGCLGSIGNGGFTPNCEKAADGYLQVTAPITSSYGKQVDSSNRNGGPPNIVQQAISSKWAKGSSGPSGDEHHNLIAIQDVRGHRDKKQHGIGIDESGGAMYTLDGTSHHAIGTYVGEEVNANGVRGFAGLPEGLDSARYRALGNAVTVTVAEWIGKRIVAYESHK